MSWLSAFGANSNRMNKRMKGQYGCEFVNKFKFFFGVNESCRVRKELDKSQVRIVTKYNPSSAVETNNK